MPSRVNEVNGENLQDPAPPIKNPGYANVQLRVVSGGDDWRRVHGVVGHTDTQREPRIRAGRHGSYSPPRRHQLQGINSKGVRGILVRGVNAPFQPEAKKTSKI